MARKALFGVLCIWFLGLAYGDGAEPGVLVYSDAYSQVRFAASEIRAAWADRGRTLVELKPGDPAGGGADTTFVLAAGADESERTATRYGLKPLASKGEQAYSIRRTESGGKTVIAVLAADAAGTMYGGLDLAESIRLGTLATLTDSDHAPHIARRGIKFNIPLDARTPSYSDNSDSAQANIPEMWSFDFWREFLDEMARHRYNVLSLWSLHPFPSIVKVPEYPEVALDDVKRTTIKLDDSFSHSGDDMVRPEMLANIETVRKMTIAEKIQFWRDVMQYANDRGIEVYIFTWNIFTFGAEGKYGITSAQTNQATIDYFRASVRETVLTYPLLAGFGITAGEHMENRKDEFSNEKWLWKTYGLGILDAKKLQPDRKVRLIHRFHMTGQSQILEEWKNYPDPFDFSFKYAIAHMYSTPAPPFIKPLLGTLPASLRTWLTVRNDDIYSFRWGDPDFARAFIRAIPPAEKIAGFYMGPDGYNWGREFLSTEPETPRQLVMKKQWYSFMLWGRLSYEPKLPDYLFLKTLAVRFPGVDSDTLAEAWAAASRIFPQITRFFWGDIDLRWFPEACLSHKRHKGFYTVRHFIEGRTMPESGILDVLTYRSGTTGSRPAGVVTPLQVADNLAGYADKTLELIRSLGPSGGKPISKELRLTLGDIQAMAHLGHYYAEKIRGATVLAFYDKAGKAEDQDAAVRHLVSALEHWKKYAGTATRQYKPQLLNRVGYVDLNQLTSRVEEDIAIARNWKPGTIPENRGKTEADVPFRP
ncbi:MAG: carbohydrate-binding family 6 protein [Acidobacteria bacterium]|nr:MAG: carbohydrate-binding family 6 protein [Acidobacteriota bacterium]